jgi:hypothetical protein
MVNSLLYQFKSRPNNKAARGAIRGKSEIGNKTNTFGKRAWRKERVGWNNYLNRRLGSLPGGDLLLYPLWRTSMSHGCDSHGSLARDRR